MVASKAATVMQTVERIATVAEKVDLLSGDSSAVLVRGVRRGTVDQEIAGSNPTNGRNLFLLCARFLGLLRPIGKMNSGFRRPGSST